LAVWLHASIPSLEPAFLVDEFLREVFLSVHNVGKFRTFVGELFHAKGLILAPLLAIFILRKVIPLEIFSI
jgi:hypothetical protein